MFDTINEAAVWAIFFLPVASLALIAVQWALRTPDEFAALTIIAALVGSFGLALWALDSGIDADGHIIGFGTHEWLSLGDLTVNIGIRLDGLTSVMLVVVSAVSLLVQVYSVGYMHGDPGYKRYFAVMSLFTAAMLGLVLADNLIMLFVFWELVGASSYLLIGFWFRRPSAAAAAKKAFIVTRLGDLGFLLAILLIYREIGTFDIEAIHEAALAGAIGSAMLSWFAVGVFAGAAGKSAQFPLHVWLPDAMEGPTPVSALIHAATMVAAGVYLVARLFPVFSVSDEAMTTVAVIGSITALGAALLGVVMFDIKRVLAYSTISQLGYMMVALGVGAYVAAIFHLMTHAFFKALLFLGSGSVNHATNTFDMRRMGGLARAMPVTAATFVIGALSLSGIPPFAGFWSKDEVLAGAFDENWAYFLVLLGAAFLTAFYMFRAIFMTFAGEYRGGEPAAADGHAGGDAEEHAAEAHEAHPHESPWVMALPLVVLAVPAVLVGFWNIDHDFTHLVEGALPEGVEVHEFEFEWPIATASTGVALLGVFTAAAIYYEPLRVMSAEWLGARLRPAWTLLSNRYYLDALYETVVVRWLFYAGLVRALALFDQYVVDGIVNGAARTGDVVGERVRRVETGQLQAYGASFIVGAAVVAAGILIVNP
ncbi:MAG TPA: NADH-quinone oxidoreductase subunit L [Dehalococcoidia bacterium]|nr:NADH-quinone oxidoreductase subunit L [Dehalococcoidia bacterium]